MNVHQIDHGGIVEVGTQPQRDNQPGSQQAGKGHRRYAPGDPVMVAELAEHFSDKYLYAPDEELETIIAHANLEFDVAQLDAGIEHSTEWLDQLLAEQVAAMSVLARRDQHNYSIERIRPAEFPRQWLDGLKRDVRISELLRRQGAELFKRGRGFVARCPFPDHEDRYPSFYVYEDTNSCWCFGCQRGGDVFDLIELTEGLSFPDAVHILAERAGLPVPQPRRVMRMGEV